MADRISARRAAANTYFLTNTLLAICQARVTIRRSAVRSGLWLAVVGSSSSISTTSGWYKPPHSSRTQSMTSFSDR
jgi:hypothetical protein